MNFYDRHPISEQRVLAAVVRRRGGDLSRLTPDDLFEFDQDHYGGLKAVDDLARRDRGRLKEWRAAPPPPSWDGSRALLGRAGFVRVETEDLSDEWRPLGKTRLATFRAMGTAARLGEARAREYEQLYAFLVGLVED